MATYKVVIKKYNTTLNTLLTKEHERYDPRTKKMRRWNDQKPKDDLMIHKALLSQLGRITFDSAIMVHFKFFTGNKKDLDNISGSFHKSFFDALQGGTVKENKWWKYIDNDNSKFVYGFTDDFETDKKYKDTMVWIAIEEVNEKPTDNYDWNNLESEDLKYWE